MPVGKTASARYIALLRTVASSRIFTRTASKNTTGYIRSSGRLPGGHFRDDAIGDTDQIGRHLHAVHLGKEPLDLADRHPAGVEGQNLVVDPAKRRSCLPINRGSKRGKRRVR
jgi:hypothetical protein